MTGYVRHAHICMTWTQKRWKRNGGHVTHIPTEDEEDALVRTLSSLQAVESVKLEWQSKPDSSVPRLRDITSAIAAGTHTTSLTLLAPATDLNAFARAADPVMMRQLTHLEVEFVRGNRQVPTDLSALGQCIATAGDAQLASLHLIVRTTVSLKALLDKMSESTMRRLTVFKMAIPIIEIENGHGDYSHQLKLLLHHVAPRLEHFSLDMHSHPTSEAIIAWRERWQTPLLALQILNLSWPSLHSVGSIFHSWPRKAIHQDVFAQSTLPWISSTGTSLTELCLGNVVLQEESLHKLVHAVERTLLRLQRLRIGLHIIQPQTLDIISRSCMDLAELEIRYKYLLAPNGPTIEFMDDVDLWDCDHELWARAISVRRQTVSIVLSELIWCSCRHLPLAALRTMTSGSYVRRHSCALTDPLCMRIVRPAICLWRL